MRKFFSYDGAKDECVCKICVAKFQGTHITNLKRHMVSNHLKIFNEEKEKFAENTGKEVSSCAKEKRKFSVSFTKDEVTNACVEFVTKESKPFSFFDCNAFKVLTQQIFNGLNISPITSSNIMEHVDEKYSSLKNHIIKTLKGQILCLKMDTATRHDRAILGINVQLITGNKICIYTLSCKELTRRHTAEHLKEELQNVLEEFEIHKNQIYAITTDNGRNMIKAVELFSNESISENEDDNIEFYEKSVENLMRDMCTENPNIISIKCAAHTLQLAVKDFFSSNSKEVVIRARQIAKSLRTPNYR